jgi:benzoyl-CoA reductase/2-hydroxyglutaryl-CoA dehydratase subunit BcrC/BadD/HgdB
MKNGGIIIQDNPPTQNFQIDKNSQPQGSTSASSQSNLKPLDPAMAQSLKGQLEYLASINSGIKSLDYFYEVYKELYGNRTKELENAKQNGKKIIGVFCNFVPLELILAADAVPIRLASGFQETILQAEEILPRNFCPLIKSSYGFSLMNSPHFELADVIIIPTTCDGKKKLGEILAERKPTWVIEVPHTSETPQARQLWLTEIQLLKKQLEKLTGNKITAKKLRAAIELVNRKRAVSRRLFEQRKKTPPPIWGRDAMLVTNLSLYDDIPRWTQRAEALCDELEKHKPVCDISMPRIMITGSPTVFPTWKIPILIEESGGVIVIDDVCTGSKELWDPIETANWTMNDMLIAIADKYLMNTCACFTPNLVRVDRILQFVNDFKVDGTIYHILQACHIYGMEEQRIEKALDRVNIPVLSIETDYSQEDVEQIRTRVEAFIEMVSIRKHTPTPGVETGAKTAEYTPSAVPAATVASKTPTASSPVAVAATNIPSDSPIAPAHNQTLPRASDPTPVSGPPKTQTQVNAQVSDPTPISSPPQTQTQVNTQVSDPTQPPTPQQKPNPAPENTQIQESSEISTTNPQPSKSFCKTQR